MVAALDKPRILSKTESMLKGFLLAGCILTLFDLAVQAEDSVPDKPTPPAIPSATPSIKTFEFRPNTLNFIPEKNGVKVHTPQLTYSVDQSEDLHLSSVRFNGDTFKATVGSPKSLGVKKPLAVDTDETLLLLTFPAALGGQGLLEVLSEDGKIIYTAALNESHFRTGQELAVALPGEFWGSAVLPEQNNAVIADETLKENILDSNRKSGFRFCWVKRDETYFLRACTPYYRYSKKDNTIKIQTQAPTTKVFINQKESKPEGTLELQPGKDIRFLALTNKGYSVEFFSQPHPLLLTDFFFDGSQKWIYLIGHTNPPTFPETKLFPAIDPKSLIATLRWTPTIGNLRTYWATLVPIEKTQLVVPGRGGGLFLYNLEIPSAPSFDSRIQLEDPLKSTYSSKPVVKGSSKKSVNLSALPPGKLKTSKKSENFLWQMSFPIQGAEQENGLVIKEKEQSFQAYYSIYRGYSGEFSLRLAGVVSAALQINLLGEAAYNQWFESLFGWDNDYLSRQRWGISLRHFAPLKSFTPQGSTATPITLRLTTFDLKYRLSPGLWERDESWGLILGAEDVVINNIHGAFGGGGFFWARSMPEIFDVIFNWFPYMNYPKWVDMEMIYYLAPLSATVAPGTTPTYAVNFHGKVLWKKFFFGEAGFGLKAYHYKVEKQSVRLQALYGTAGLGFNF